MILLPLSGIEMNSKWMRRIETRPEQTHKKRKNKEKQSKVWMENKKNQQLENVAAQK